MIHINPPQPPNQGHRPTFEINTPTNGNLPDIREGIFIL